MEVNNDDSTFEMSIRVLGNEFLGFKISVDDFKTKWLVLTVMATAGIGAVVATFGEPIKNLAF